MFAMLQLCFKITNIICLISRVQLNFNEYLEGYHMKTYKLLVHYFNFFKAAGLLKTKSIKLILN